MAARPLTRGAAAHYRRGTVLGLTVAEVFILLLFLLLLAFLGLATPEDTERRNEELTKNLAEARQELAVVRDRYEAWDPVIREFKKPDEIATLRRGKAAAEREAAEVRAAAEAALAQADEALAKADEALAKAESEADKAQAEAEEARGAGEAARRELRILQEKGQNPPCWYERISDDRGERERTHYIFDIAVFEQYMVVRRAPTPPGGAVDDGGKSYRAEAVELGLDRLPYDTPLSDDQVLRHLLPVHRAGKDGRVRSYSCVFWVRVWDMTPTHAKPRWKRAHDKIIEGMFGAYSVEGLPWPPAAE